MICLTPNKQSPQGSQAPLSHAPDCPHMQETTGWQPQLLTCQWHLQPHAARLPRQQPAAHR